MISQNYNNLKSDKSRTVWNLRDKKIENILKMTFITNSHKWKEIAHLQKKLKRLILIIKLKCYKFSVSFLLLLNSFLKIKAKLGCMLSCIWSWLLIIPSADSIAAMARKIIKLYEITKNNNRRMSQFVYNNKLSFPTLIERRVWKSKKYIRNLTFWKEKTKGNRMIKAKNRAMSNLSLNPNCNYRQRLPQTHTPTANNVLSCFSFHTQYSYNILVIKVSNWLSFS